MYDLSWSVIIFYSVPECFLIVLIGLYLIRLKLLPVVYTTNEFKAILLMITWLSTCI